MKTLFSIIILVATGATHYSIAQDTTQQNPLPQLLTQYYTIKNALVAGKASDASSAATSFVRTANGIDYKVISEGNLNTLVSDAGKISGTNDITKQRQYFANFSTNMASVAKAVKLTDKTIYNAYCPMKKASWLSSEKVIKNPYYGSSMLTCGEVTETIE